MNALEQHNAAGDHTHFGFKAGEDADAREVPETPEITEEALREHASNLVQGWELAPADRGRNSTQERLKKLRTRLRAVLEEARKRARSEQPSSALDLVKSRRMLDAVIAASTEDLRAMGRLPHVHIATKGRCRGSPTLRSTTLARRGGCGRKPRCRLL